MTSRNDTYAVIQRFAARGLTISFEDANSLRRAELTLQRWAELKCGDGNDFASWSIERDEETGLPYRCIYPHSGKMTRYRIPDREAGALRRVKAICERNGWHFYHQGDPRGCSLYVSNEPIGNDYTRGVSCCA